MNDLIERLRATHDTAPASEDWRLCCEAADEIERLTANLTAADKGLAGQAQQIDDQQGEVARLTAIVQSAVVTFTDYELCVDDYPTPQHRAFMEELRRVAKAAESEGE